jgi:hypothetical protein
MRRAQANIDRKRESLLVALDGNLAELANRFGTASAQGSPGDYVRLHRLGSDVIDASGGLPGSLIDEAAHALCALADRGATLGRWDAEAVAAHVMVLRLLRNGDLEMVTPQRESLVDGLRKISAKRFGTPTVL